MENDKIHTKEDVINSYADALNEMGNHNLWNLLKRVEIASKWYYKTFEKPEPIPFSLELYETGKYDCVTREGEKARFICVLDSGLPNNIVFAFYEKGFRDENNGDFTKDGNYFEDNSVHRFDIFLIQKP